VPLLMIVPIGLAWMQRLCSGCAERSGIPVAQDNSWYLVNANVRLVVSIHSRNDLPSWGCWTGRGSDKPIILRLLPNDHWQDHSATLGQYMNENQAWDLEECVGHGRVMAHWATPSPAYHKTEL
jgi:hypothetical protein